MAGRRGMRLSHRVRCSDDIQQGTHAPRVRGPMLVLNAAAALDRGLTAVLRRKGPRNLSIDSEQGLQHSQLSIINLSLPMGQLFRWFRRSRLTPAARALYKHVFWQVER